MRPPRTAMTVIAAAAIGTAGLGLAGAPSARAATAPSSGWNNWNCKPSAEHPEPVVLAHGMGSNGTENFLTLAPSLVSAGYCVYSTTYGQTVLGSAVAGLGPMDKSAQTLAHFVTKVRTSTGAAKVDIVGHSEGTTVPAYYMKFLGGDKVVNRYVGFGANYQGTSLSGLGTLAKALHFQPVLNGVGCQACSQFLTGSDFPKKLNAGGVSVAGPHYVNIVSKYDKIVTPYSSGIMAPASNVRNVVLQDACSADFAGHVGMAVDPNIAALTKHYLDPEHTAKPGCTFFPGFGF